jgi:DNA-binding Lrp family transcriptional regulator
VTHTRKLHLDNIDLRILTEVARDAYRSNREISGKLKMAEATVRHRIQTLVDNQWIIYDVTVNPVMSRWKAICYMRVMLKVNSEPKIRAFTRKFGQLQNVTSIETISDEYDLMLRVEAEDGDALTRIRRNISDSPLVSRIVTLHVQKNFKRFRLPFEALPKPDRRGLTGDRRRIRAND